MSSSISVCWGYFSLLWSGSLGILVHQHQWWCVLRDSWGILLIKAMMGSKCFRQSLRKSERFFFLCLPLELTAFSLFHLIVLVPFFSLQFVMDVGSLLQSMKAKTLGSWGNGRCLCSILCLDGVSTAVPWPGSFLWEQEQSNNYWAIDIKKENQ